MPKKGENIYKRSDGRWEGRYIKHYELSGKAKYGYVYAKTYREVKEKLVDAVAANKTGLIQDNRKDLFGDIAQVWLSSISPFIKQSTLNKYHNLLEAYILPYFASARIQSITHEHIEKLCCMLLSHGGVHQQGLSPKTVADVLSVVRSVLQYAIKLGIPLACNGQSVRIKQKPKELRILSRSEQDVLVSYLLNHSTNIHTGILMCLFTGMRVGEICALRWEDISFPDQTIHVCRTMQRIQDQSGAGAKTKIVITSPKSICSDRTIPLPEKLIDILCELRPRASGYFLTNSDSSFIEPRTLQNHFKRVLHECGMENVNFHILRHTFATRCIELGFDVKTLSEILGHSSVNITMNRYVHPTMELKKDQMSRLEKLFAVK